MKNTHVQLHKNIDKAETLLKLMANSARLLVLCNLASGEKNVTDLVKAVKLSQPAVSQHLARMRYEGLVATKKKGQSVFYRIAKPEVLQLVNAIEKIYTKSEKGAVEEKVAPAKSKVKAKAKPAKAKEKPKKFAEPTQLSFLK